MKIFIFPILLLLFIPVQLSANGEVPDSILSKINSLEGKERLNVWKQWHYSFNFKDKDIWIKSIDVACDDAFSILPQDSALIWCYTLKANLIIQHVSAGLKEESLELLKELKVEVDSVMQSNEGLEVILAKWYMVHANFYYMNLDFDLALETYDKALTLNEKIGDQSLNYTLHTSMAMVSSINNQPKKAIEHYAKAESLFKNLNLPYASFITLNYYQAFLYRELKDYNKAHEKFEMILDSVDLVAPSVKMRIMIDYASNLNMIGKDSEALQLFEKLETQIDTNTIIGNRLEFAERYADCLFKMGRYEKGMELNAEARVVFQKDLENKRSGEVMEWQAKFENSEKEKEIKNLEQEKIIANSRFKSNLALVGFIGLFGIGILTYFLQRAKSRRKQMALTLERDRQINEYRDRLFSSITHDIRTPLALMMAPLERAQSRIKDNFVKSDIQLAQRNGKRLMELFNQILDWNRAEAKAMELNNQVGRLDITLDSLCERFEQQAVENGIKFKKELAVIDNQILLDFDKIDKVLSNLIGNAIKFCTAGQEVKLIASTKEEGGRMFLNLEVSDEGPGIDEEDQKNIFERYFQGKQGQLKGGTGIGLSLVHELVQIMEGQIQLESEIGKGTTFLVTLPIRLAEEIQIDQLEAAEQIAPGTSPAMVKGEKPLILVIEDEPELLEFLRSALVESYEVEIANSSTIGLSIAISRIPDIIISDWNLPDQNGGWLSREIGKNPITSHIPVLILTAYSNEANQKEAFDSGAVAWMNKPFKLEVLERQLQTILNQQRKVQNLWSKKVSPDLITEAQPPEVDPFLQKVIDHIKANMRDEKYSVEKMADDLHISRVQLFRKVRSLTGNSPSKMIKEYRLQKGRQLLKSTKLSVAEIAFEVGFSEPSYFSTVYKQFFEVSPTQDQSS